MTTGLTVIRILLPLAVIGAGAAIMGGLVATKPEAEPRPDKDTGVVVRTVEVHSTKEQVTVPAQGTVVAAREIRLQPEVAGRVTMRSENLVPGGRFKQGEVLLRIDPSEYAIRAEQSAAQVEQAKQQLALEASRGEIAKQEWAIIGEDAQASEAGRSAALRQPQQQEALARMRAAEQDRDMARLNLGRTALQAPFNGFVLAGQVDVGQYVSPGIQLGTLVGSDKFWVQISIPVDRLTSISVPGFNAPQGEGSPAHIWQDLGDQRVRREGGVVRLLGDVDPVGRMARVLVEIDDPLGTKKPKDERGLPLLLGAYVHVDIEGKNMLDVLEVPRAAVHAGRYVYLYSKDDRLEIREVEIAWRRPDSFLVSEGLEEGDRVITSRVGNAVEGLKLRMAEADAPGGPVAHARKEAPPKPESGTAAKPAQQKD